MVAALTGGAHSTQHNNRQRDATVKEEEKGDIESRGEGTGRGRGGQQVMGDAKRSESRMGGMMSGGRNKGG